VSLAVGDVNFVIEALQLSEHVGVGGLPLTPLHKRVTNNVLVVNSDGSYFTVYDETLRIGGERHQVINSLAIENGKDIDKAFQLSFLEPGMRVRIHPLRGRPQSVFFKSCSMRLVETIDSGIPELQVDPDNYEDTSGYDRSYAKWIIGLDWTGYIDL
ncbi:hypothetical protein OSTOST_10250, partial [Ostertagia ostertagi]